MVPQTLVRLALLSVSDKTGIADFARRLAERGVVLVSTGGTAERLREAGLEVRGVADVTGAPEILDGRVKTLHPKIHGGILARRERPEDMATLAREGIEAFDLVVANLYPFERTIEAGAGFAQAVENIDIGGPAMIRAAAKNHESVLVVVDPADYDAVIEAIDAGAAPPALRRRLALTAFARTSAYDAAITTWLQSAAGSGDEPAPRHLRLAGERSMALRYGENPHQKAALYTLGAPRPGVAGARQLQGKPLSYNNLQDADAAFELVAEFDGPSCAIIKHTNPCGVASAATLALAHERALAADPVSAFGGVVAFNTEIDGATARALTDIFTEVVIAPAASEEARAVIATKPALRLLTTGGLPERTAGGMVYRSIAGGLLAQERDAGTIGAEGLTTVTRREPDEAELESLLFAWKVCKHVRSNAIVVASGTATLGVGCGQTSRVDAVTAALRRMKGRIGGPIEDRREGRIDESRPGAPVLASDAFFPFADGLNQAAEAGVRAVIQPGGSIKDAEVIAAADAADVAMVFTGRRHFRH
ncbi:MAG: bifunctional phosphoribosylaminoimidazolecarboxamide formyltransferase/IMP cyclohydrolase [Geminicoccaceae bacterium]|nr:bifunctional phosphoribosylaminoimidazolecarboxamide formyltransferase/IMP cyclohydrolase [Geminicoccaceae bacterium]